MNCTCNPNIPNRDAAGSWHENVCPQNNSGVFDEISFRRRNGREADMDSRYIGFTNYRTMAMTVGKSKFTVHFRRTSKRDRSGRVIYEEFEPEPLVFAFADTEGV
jgi:hypothetical protein